MTIQTPLSGDDSLDGVIAHVRDIGWSLLVTYWDEGNPDARKLDALPDKVDGILIDEGGHPRPAPPAPGRQGPGRHDRRNPGRAPT